MRFWDSSAVLPLVVAQPGRDEAKGWLAVDDRIVLWTLTEIEVLSALHRLHRDGALSDAAVHEAERLVESWVRRAHSVRNVEEVKVRARRLLRLHSLRAADSLQLAAALAWADGLPEGLVLHTFDRRLAMAALREGFSVLPAP